jgi:hypothetical protein
LVDGVAETERVAGLQLDQPVVALAGDVGDAGEDERLDLRPPCFDGCGKAVQFGDVGVGAPSVEDPEAMGDLVARRGGAGQGQQRAELFLRDPGGEDLFSSWA